MDSLLKQAMQPKLEHEDMKSEQHCAAISVTGMCNKHCPIVPEMSAIKSCSRAKPIIVHHQQLTAHTYASHAVTCTMTTSSLLYVKSLAHSQKDPRGFLLATRTTLCPSHIFTLAFV